MSSTNSDYSKERAELQAILDSGIFARSPNLQKFLVFVCEKYFAGAVDEIKEYLVAVEALGRPADFDQKRDSIVRVEAHRLRKRLDEYYRGPGATSTVQIRLASGSYVPQFVAAAGTAREPADRPPASETAGRAEIVTGSNAGNAHTVPILVDPDLGAPSPNAPEPARRRWRLLPMEAAAVLVLVGVGLWYATRVGTDPDAATRAAVANVAPRSMPGGEPGDAPVTGPQPVRILAGSPFSSFVDRFGQTWTGDAYFDGGSALENKLGPLHFTALPEIYQFRREGEFSYKVPLDPGVYELRLHFVEPIFGEENLAGGGETSRLFSVYLNDELVLHEFDILADAFGAANANVKVFRNVRPGEDGRLHIDFRPGMHESPVVSGIELLPMPPGATQPVRIVASERGFTDQHGNYWSADHYVSGGRFVRRGPISHPDFDGMLFQGERYGNFTYMVPVAKDGKYRVRLYFCERWWGPNTHAGGGVGSRRFDVFVNGRALLVDFDLFQQAGGTDQPILREFSGVTPNAQGKLILQFVPRQNYAMLNALEIWDEASRNP
jgi:hypothetical protein